jgi:lycopene beta-cyclase
MTAVKLDAVIAGGGLSGLSLAAYLATSGWGDRRVLVVDDGACERAATCWASWTDRPQLLDAAVSRSYEHVRICAAGQARTVDLAPYRYQLVRRADLRGVVGELLDGCAGFEVRCGRVDAVHDGPDAAEVVVDGTPVQARWAFDSRPAATDAPVDARLAFTGWQVRSRRPLFSPEVPVLFDFRTPQMGRARFVYVLPDDACNALVELTEFVPHSARPSPPVERDVALSRYLADCVDYTIVRTESAVLPLRTRQPRRAFGRVLAIGARAGLIKASTGYGYQRIQRDSQAIARSLARYGHPFDLPRPRPRHRLLDALLLDTLDRDPAQLQRAFASLFLGNPAGTVLRFLDEDTSVLDDLRLISSMPPWPYLKALARYRPLVQR